MSSPASIGRRRFLALAGTAAAVAGAHVLPQPALGAAAETKQVWMLDPEWGAGQPACPDPHAGSQSCHACRACHSHAAAKMWTSQTLADQRRAHLHCKCLVTHRDVSEGEYVMIFGPPSGPQHRDEFDRRRDELFQPPSPTPLPSPAALPSTGGGPAPGGSGWTVVLLALGTMALGLAALGASRRATALRPPVSRIRRDERFLPPKGEA